MSLKKSNLVGLFVLAFLPGLFPIKLNSVSSLVKKKSTDKI